MRRGGLSTRARVRTERLALRLRRDFWLRAAEAAGAEAPMRIDIINVKDYGATGDGATDDRAAIQTAIDAAVAGGMALYFPTGTYRVSQVVGQSYSFSLSGVTDLAVYGAGPRSVLKVLNISTSSDYHMVLIRGGSSGIAFYDLAFDGNFPSGTSPSGYVEQNHLVQVGLATAVGGTAENITFSRCRFVNARGDGIRLMGHASAQMRNIRVTDCHFEALGRSGIAFQRDTHDVQVLGCYFTDINDSPIDFEPSSTAFTDTNTNTVINGNMFYDPTRNGGAMISLSGVGASGERNYRSSFSDNILIGGRIDAINIDSVDICHNTIIIDTADGAEPAIYLYRGVTDVTVHGNKVTRNGTVAGACIAVEQNGGVRPVGIQVTNNICKQYGDASIIRLENVDDGLVQGNHCYYYSATTNTDIGIVCNAPIANNVGTIIANNFVRGATGGGTLQYGIQVGGGGFAMSQVVITGNIVSGSTGAGIRFEGTWTDRPVVAGNYGDVGSVVTPSGIIAAGNGGGDHAVFVGTATPEGAVTAPIGSLYMRTDGGASTSLYVKESGTGNTGWVAK